MTARKWRLVLLIVGAVFVIGLGWYRSKLKITRRIMLRSGDHLKNHVKRQGPRIIELLKKHHHSKWAEMQEQKEGWGKLLEPLEKAKLRHKVEKFPANNFGKQNRALYNRRLKRIRMRGFIRLKNRASRVARLHAKRIAKFHQAQQQKYRKVVRNRQLRRH